MTVLLCIPAGVFAGGKIEVVGPSSVDFGKYPAWEKRVGRYTIRNAGDGVLNIVDIRKGCGCATAAASKSQLPPGETATVEVEIRANSIYGVYKKKCFVETTDPRQKFTRLDIGGNAVPLADVRPSREFHAGRLSLGRPWSKTFQIVPRGEKALRLGEPRVTDNYGASAELGEVEDGGSYSLGVSLDPPKVSGDWKCEVGIPVLSPTNHAPLVITVTAAIGEILICIPSMTYLKVSEKPVERVFHVRLLSSTALALAPGFLLLPTVEGVTFRNVRKEEKGRGLMMTAVFSSEFTRQLAADGASSFTIGSKSAASATVKCVARE